jgi:hypothetical protein
MLGRLLYALILGVVLGIIVAGGVAYATARRDTPPAPARGDLNAPFDLALTFTETFLAERIENPPAPRPGTPTSERPRLRGAVVRILPDGTIRVRGETTMRGLTVPVRATLLPRVAGGQIEMAIVDGRAGGLGIPTSIADDVEAAVNRQLRSVAAQRAVEVVAIVPGDGLMTVRLR